MQTIHGFIVALHVLTGALSLLLFWVPSFTRKGGKAHKQFGGYYSSIRDYVERVWKLSPCKIES